MDCDTVVDTPNNRASAYLNKSNSFAACDEHKSFGNLAKPFILHYFLFQEKKNAYDSNDHCVTVAFLFDLLCLFLSTVYCICCKTKKNSGEICINRMCDAT